MAKISYYGVVDVVTANYSVTTSWSTVQKITKGHAIVRKFFCFEDAVTWSKKMSERVKVGKVFNDAVFFDAGTSRLSMVEARVTDNDGNSVLDTVVNKAYLNDKGNLAVSWKRYSHNFGELLACCLALKYATQQKKKAVYGDSAITIFFWLSGSYDEKLDKCTVALIKNAYAWLTIFENTGGKLFYISRERNRADLFYTSL